MKTFCLCLPENPSEIERAKAHFAESGVGDVDFIWGINAPVAGLATSHCYDVDHPGTNFRMGAKPTGCWISHWMLWQIMIQHQDDRFLVLEADAKFHEGWKAKMDEALSVTPSNFDLLHIGSCCLEGHPRTHIGGDVYETKKAQCTHAYIISRKCIPFLLRTVRKCYAPIDCQLVLECFPHLLTYAVMPRIVSQFNTVLPP